MPADPESPGPMDPERWREVSAAFGEAVELDPDALPGYMDALRERDAELAAAVARLLAADEQTAGLLDGLAIDSVDADGLAIEGVDVDGDGIDRVDADGAGIDRVGAADPADPAEGPDASAPVESGGRRIGAYRLLRPLGSGGMGAVWLAERADGAYRGQVAIKLIRTGFEQGEVARRFVSERQILAALDHPNIARLLDGGETEDGTPYLVMEVVDGEPIDAYCDRERLGVRDRIALFLQVCAAVQYAHGRLVVHRDLKPSNILVPADGAPRLLDFGIAKLLDASEVGVSRAEETRTGARLLTPRFASPEQVRGEPITAASDVYSLGVLLYELLTGRQPYAASAATAARVERAILEDEPTRPSVAVSRSAGAAGPSTGAGADGADRADAAAGTDGGDGGDGVVARARRASPDRLRRSLEGDLDTIILAALRKDPDRRYGSVEAFARDLRRYLDGLPVEARPDTWSYRAAKFVRRNRTGVGIAAGFVLVLAASSVALAIQAARVTRERDAAEAERAKAEQVADFLVDVFESSDPSEAGGVDMTASQILARGREKIVTELGGQPEVQAAVFDAIGGVWQALGEYDSAFVYFTSALDLRETTLGPGHPEYATSLTRLGTLARIRADYDRARDLNTQALEVRRAAFGDWSEPVANSLSNLGMIAGETGDPVAAESLHLKSVEIRRDLLDPADDRIAQSLNNLAAVYDERGSADTAIAIMAEAVDIRREALGENHVDFAIALNNLATAYENAGRYDEAEPLYMESLAIRTRLLGEVHPDVATVNNNLGVLYIRMGRISDAIPYLRGTVAFRRTRPDERFALAIPLNNLGMALTRQGEYEDGRAAFEESLELFEAEVGPDHPTLAFPLSGIANTSENLGDMARAEEALRRALAIRQAAFEPPHPLIATAMDALGTHLFERGLSGDAESLLVQAYEMRVEVLDADHPDLANSLLQLGELRYAQGQYEEAEALGRRGLEIREAKLDPGSIEVAQARGLVGKVLVRLDRTDEAEPLLRASWETLSERLEPDDAAVRSAAGRLADLYEATGSTSEAERFRALAEGQTG